MKMLGHDKIDLLKLDVEGAEYQVIEDIGKTGVEITQLLVEFHTRFFKGEEGIKKRKRAIELLNRTGLKIFHVTSRDEYSFIKK